MILAQYTIRSKQEYIFRSNRLLDIVGGTEMIRDAFDWVFAAAEQEGVTCQPADVPFKLQAVQDAFAAGTLGMAELFRGGGHEGSAAQDLPQRGKVIEERHGKPP